jgi:tRNA(Ser,Leu) C12 N-acetylase TAN1
MADKKEKNIKQLDDYLKAYEVEQKAKKTLDEMKDRAIKFLQENTDGKIEYKKKNIALVNTNRYEYPTLAEEIKHFEAIKKDLDNKQKIAVLDGSAKVKEVSTYIKLSDVKKA